MKCVVILGMSDLEDKDIVWTPKRDPELGPRAPNTVGTLFQSCIALVVDHIEDVESLWGIPDVIKARFHKKRRDRLLHTHPPTPPITCIMARWLHSWPW